MSMRIKLYYFSNFTAADQGHDGFELAGGLYMTCSSELASQLSFSPTPGNQVVGATNHCHAKLARGCGLRLEG
jgi:hypothetical protein